MSRKEAEDMVGGIKKGISRVKSIFPKRGKVKRAYQPIKPKEKTLALTKEILLDVWNKRLADVDNLKRNHENSLDEIRAKIRNLVDRLSKTENENLVRAYEKELEKLSNEEQILENQSQVMRSRKPDFGTALDITFNFLKNPYLYWKKDDLKSKFSVVENRK